MCSSDVYRAISLVQNTWNHPPPLSPRTEGAAIIFIIIIIIIITIDIIILTITIHATISYASLVIIASWWTGTRGITHGALSPSPQVVMLNLDVPAVNTTAFTVAQTALWEETWEKMKIGVYSK